MAGLCDVDTTTPSDGTIESTWPGYLRTFEQKVVDSFTKGHTCDGSHFYGVDTFSIGNPNLYQVDVGAAAFFVRNGLYDGVTVLWLPGSTNTSTAPSLQVLSNGTALRMTASIFLFGAHPPIGSIIVGVPIWVSWNATNGRWDIIAGSALTSAGLPAIPPVALPTGTRIQLSYAQTGFSAVSGTTAKTSLGTITFPSNTYTSIEVEADIIGTALGSTVAGVIELDIAGSSVEGFGFSYPVPNIFRNATFHMRVQAAGGQGGTTTVELFVTLDNSNMTIAIKNLSVVGIV